MNRIEFRKVDLEDWMIDRAIDFGVAVMIDGEDLNTKLARCHPDGKYDPGHLDAMTLLYNLTNALIPGTYDYKYGAFVCCCQSCGEEGCDGAEVRVRQDKKHVYWNHFSAGTGIVDYSSLSFVFDRDEYETELKKLEAWYEEEKQTSARYYAQMNDPLHEVSSIEFRQATCTKYVAALAKNVDVWIRVNGFPLDDAFQEIVSWNWHGDFLNAAKLHSELSNAFRPGTQAYKHGVLIGRLTNEQGVTLRIRAHVLLDDKYVIWQDIYDETGHADFSNLFFRFERTEYDTAMDKLLGMVRV